MKNELFKKAKLLKSRMDDYKSTLDGLRDERNWMNVPDDMFKRHLGEKREWLAAELQKLEEEFDAI